MLASVDFDDLKVEHTVACPGLGQSLAQMSCLLPAGVQ